MAYTPEDNAVLQAAIDGVPRVAAAIAELPDDSRQRAIEAAEQSYRKTLQELEYPEDAADSWVAAVMYRLTAEVQKIARTREPDWQGGPSGAARLGTS